MYLRRAKNGEPVFIYSRINEKLKFIEYFGGSGLPHKGRIDIEY